MVCSVVEIKKVNQMTDDKWLLIGVHTGYRTREPRIFRVIEAAKVHWRSIVLCEDANGKIHKFSIREDDLLMFDVKEKAEKRKFEYQLKGIGPHTEYTKYTTFIKARPKSTHE